MAARWPGFRVPSIVRPHFIPRRPGEPCMAQRLVICDFEVQVAQPHRIEMRMDRSWEQTRRIQDCHCHCILHLFAWPSVAAPQVLEYDFEADRWKTNVSFRSGGKKRRRTGAPFSSACFGCPCPCAASHLRDVIHN